MEMMTISGMPAKAKTARSTGVAKKNKIKRIPIGVGGILFVGLTGLLLFAANATDVDGFMLLHGVETFFGEAVVVVTV